MAEYFDAQGNPVELDDDGAPQRMAQIPRKVVRRLEKEAAEAESLRAENEQLKRERSFVQAGIPLEDKRAAYFIAGYQGEQTPEAIRSEWNESFGNTGTAGNAAIDQELRQQAQAQQLVSGVGSPSPDLLAQRDAELAALSQTDPYYPAKFDAIFAKYGGRSGSMVG